jgi:peroxiredoxin Q/BCP
MKGAGMARSLRLTLSTALACLVGTMTFGQPVELKVGDKAPDFNLQGTDGKMHTLSEYKGHTVILAWFPKAFTGG